MTTYVVVTRISVTSTDPFGVSLFLSRQSVISYQFNIKSPLSDFCRPLVGIDVVSAELGA